MSALYHCLGCCFRQQTRNKIPDRKPSGISRMVCGGGIQLNITRLLLIKSFTDSLVIALFLKYNQQDATLYNILYYCQCSTCFRRFLRPSSGAQKLYTASGICEACLPLPLAWVSFSSPTLLQIDYENLTMQNI